MNYIQGLEQQNIELHGRLLEVQEAQFLLMEEYLVLFHNHGNLIAESIVNSYAEGGLEAVTNDFWPEMANHIRAFYKVIKDAKNKMLRIERKNQKLVKRLEEVSKAHYNFKIWALSQFILLEDSKFYSLINAKGIAKVYYHGGIKNVLHEYEELADYQENWGQKIIEIIARYEEDFPPFIRK